MAKSMVLCEGGGHQVLALSRRRRCRKRRGVYVDSPANYSPYYWIWHSMCSRAQWIRLYGVLREDISVLNVYTSMDVKDRITLWEELLSTLSCNYCWILNGDWNTVERREDKSTECGMIMSDGEKLLFGQFTLALKVEDVFPNTSLIKYIWDNKKRDGIRILA